MNLIAFDTATEVLAVALATPGGAHRLNTAGGAAASAGLVPAIETLLRRAGLSMPEVQAIAFGRGPGAFTGLRTSCAVAQGLGFGLARPLWPLDSLLIVAEDARAQAGLAQATVGVVADARMGEAYAARYRVDAGRWYVDSAPALYTLEALLAAWQGVRLDLLAGSGIAAFAPRLQSLAHAQAVAHEADRAAALLRLALAAVRDEPGVDAAQALPLYLRDKVAFTTAERAAQRGAAPR